MTMAIDPEILARMPIGDEQNVRSSRIQPRPNLWPLGVGRAARVTAGDLQPGVAHSQNCRSTLGDAGRSSQKIDAPPAQRRPLTDVLNSIRAGDAFAQEAPLSARRPEHAGTVGHAQVCARQRRSKRRITPRIDEKLWIDGANLATWDAGTPGYATLHDPRIDQIERQGKINAVDCHTEDVHLLRPRKIDHGRPLQRFSDDDYV